MIASQQFGSENDQEVSVVQSSKILFFDAFHSGDVIKFVQRMGELRLRVRFIGKPICLEKIPASNPTFHGIADGAKEKLRETVKAIKGNGALLLSVRTTVRSDEGIVSEISVHIQPYQLRKIWRGSRRK